MARHGESKHWKRSVVSDALVIPRKKYKYYVRALPGKHPKRMSVPLSGLIRDVLKIARNAKEARYLIRNGMVKVDTREVKEEKYPVGFGDVVDILEDRFLMTINNMGKLTADKVEERSNEKKLKIVSKGKERAGKTVLRLSDGRNLIYEGKEEVGDTVVLDLSHNIITSVLPLEQGRTAVVFRGRNAGKTGKIVKIDGDLIYIKHDEETMAVDSDSCMVL